MPRAKGIGMRRPKKKVTIVEPGAQEAVGGDAPSPAASGPRTGGPAQQPREPKPILKPILKRGRRKAGAPRESVRSAYSAIDDACGAYDEAERLLGLATRKYDMLKRLFDIRFAKLEAAGLPECSKASYKMYEKFEKWEEELDEAWERLVACENRLERRRAALATADARLSRAYAGVPAL